MYLFIVLGIIFRSVSANHTCKFLLIYITVGIDCGGAWNVGKMHLSSEEWPINFGFLGRGNTSKPKSLLDQLAGGCLGLKIHEDWGAMPAVINTCLEVADELDFQVQLHTDTLNESGFVDDSIAAMKGRTIRKSSLEASLGIISCPRFSPRISTYLLQIHTIQREQEEAMLLILSRLFRSPSFFQAQQIPPDPILSIQWMNILIC